MDPPNCYISDSKSNTFNGRLQEVLQSTLDLNIEVEAILSSTYSDRSGFDLEVECVGDIRVLSRDLAIPRRTDRSRDSGINTEGVYVAQLHWKTRKRRDDQCIGSSRLNPENYPNLILSQEDLNSIDSKYGFPSNVEVRLPRPREKASSFDENWTYFYVVPFHIGLRFPIRGSLRDLLIH